jgi:hypothetical protein
VTRLRKPGEMPGYVVIILFAFVVLVALMLSV